MAMNNVLSSPEMLTEILVQLPMRDLLLAQRVNTFFHDLISTSPVLQRALYFRCEKPLEPSDDDCASTGSYRVNPLLYTAFPGWFGVQPQLIIPMVLFDVDLDDMELYERISWSGKKQWKRTAKGRAFLRAEASWRRMLVCQPPIQRLHLLKQFNRKYGFTITKATKDYSLAVLNNDQMTAGLRMAVLFDVIPKYDFGYPRIGVDWHMFNTQLAMDNSILPVDRPTQVLSDEPDELGRDWRSPEYDRRMYPRTFEKFKRLGIIDSDPRYYHEMTFVEADGAEYDYYRCQEDVTLPTFRSDAFERVRVYYKDLTPLIRPDNIFTDDKDLTLCLQMVNRYLDEREARKVETL